jgi:hypothetical protein
VAEIIRCVSCDGYGWFEDEGEVSDCDWCAGVGYVYRDPGGLDRKIPEADFVALAEQLEALEAARMRDMGYSGTAKKPWEQAIRQSKDDN